MDLDFIHEAGYRVGMSVLKQFRERAGLTQQQLADHAKTTQPTIARLESETRAMNKKWAQKLAPFLGVAAPALLFSEDTVKAFDVEELDRMARAVAVPGQAIRPSSNAKGRLTSDNSEQARYRPPPLLMDELNTMPLHASAEGGDGHIIVSTDEIGRVSRPDNLIGVEHAYAILLTGESMYPAYESGDRAWVHPTLPPKARKDAIFYCVDEAGETKATIKRLVSWTDSEWTVEQFNPPKTFKLDRSIWNVHHRVTGCFNQT